MVFLAGCWTLFLLFALWAEKGDLLSPEAYFLSFRARMVHYGESRNLKLLLLNYPTLPCFVSLFTPGVPFVVASCGTCGMLFASRWLFSQDTPLETLLLLAALTSPLFLSSLCSSPILTLFATLLPVAFFAILRHREWGLTHCLFASGFLLGAIALTYPHLRCIMVALGVIVLLFPGDLRKKLGLLLVLFFPIFCLLGMVAFLWWIYEGNYSGFLGFHPQSFAFYFRFSFLKGFQKSINELSHFWPFFLPFLWVALSDRRRLLWGAGALFSGILALPVFSLLAVFLVQMSGVLGWQRGKKWIRIINLVLLLVFVVLSWGKFLGDRGAFFFHLYPQLEGKLAEYRKIEELVQGKVLVVEPTYFLVASWEDTSRANTPENLSGGLSPYKEFLLYDYLITSENATGLPHFKLFWEGKELKLYQRVDALTARE